MNKRINWFVLPLSIFLLNVLLKSLYIGANTIDVDEPFSIYLAQGSIFDILKMTKQEITPPLFYIFLHYWVKFFGISSASVRFLPMLFGALTSVFIYFIGIRFYNIIIGVGAALLFTFSNLVIMESHDTRSYTLLMLLCTASMYFYLSLNENPNSRKNLTGLTITNTLLLFSNLFGIFLIGLQVFYTLVIPSVRSRILKLHCLSVSIQAIFYLPYFFIFSLTLLLRRASEPNYYEPSALSNLHLSAWAFSNYDTVFLLFAFSIILFAIILIVMKKISVTVNDIIIAGWFILLYIILYLISYKVPITNPKYFMFISPGFYITIAIAANCLYKHPLGSWSTLKNSKALWVGVVLMLLSIYKLGKTVDLKVSNFAGITDVVEIISQKKSEFTNVYLTPPWVSLSFSYYHDKNIFVKENVINALQEKNIYAVNGKNEIPEIKLKEKSDAIFVVGHFNASPGEVSNEEIFTLLRSYYSHVNTLYDSKGYKVYYFYQ